MNHDANTQHNANTQLALQLETAAAPLGGAHRHHDLLLAAARRIRDLDTDISTLTLHLAQEKTQ